MISHLTGKILLKGEKFIILDVSGVGYKVFISFDTLRGIGDKNSKVSFWTHLAVREDALDLYGFEQYAEVEMFEMLIGISGVGPKSALGIIGMAPIDTLKTAIASGDTTYLTKVSGIGKKNAQKIILELRDKLGAFNENQTNGALKEESDTVDALHSLGYSVVEAREALKNIPQDIKGASKRIKEALKILGGN
jgi:Holliday junction DNA helicase RuvA